MSIRRNIVASYLSQIYVTVAGIIVVPVYLRFMGAEAYGLIGFFATLQAWFQLLDLGLTPAMSRETARFCGGAGNATDLRRLLRALEGVFSAAAVLGGVALFAASASIATNWLRPHQLAASEVTVAIRFMAAIVAMRWVSGLYRGVISGFEEIVWLSWFNGIISSARFILVLPALYYFGFTPVNFFVFQTVVATVELSVLVAQTYRLVPASSIESTLSSSKISIRSVLIFSVSIAVSGSIWVVVTQTDKLLLSRMLSLADYGYYSLAILVASGISMISAPLATALLPRLTALCAEGDDSRLLSLYRTATQFIAIVVIPMAIALACFAREALWAWTGDELSAERAAPILALYAIGNAVLALTALPYYLQFAKGDLKLHVVGHVLFLAVLIPLLVWETSKRGAIGAGYAWVAANLAYLLVWVPMIHQHLFAGLQSKWIKDIGGVVLATAIGAMVIYHFGVELKGRLDAACELVLVALGLAATGAAGSPWARTHLGILWRTRAQLWK